MNEPNDTDRKAILDALTAESQKIDPGAGLAIPPHNPTGKKVQIVDVELAELREVLPFRPFKKIFRLNREVVVTEKIDGTNGVILITPEGLVIPGSRSQWISVKEDHFGFAAWVKANEDELRTGLGPGTHYGEWWGRGVQKRYPNITEKRFSLFNVTRWADDTVRPKCCHVVPILAQGMDIRATTEDALARLRAEGSIADPGNPRPEGVVVFHTPSGHLFKVTLEKDEAPKSMNPAGEEQYAAHLAETAADSLGGE